LQSALTKLLQELPLVHAWSGIHNQRGTFRVPTKSEYALQAAVLRPMETENLNVVQHREKATAEDIWDFFELWFRECPRQHHLVEGEVAEISERIRRMECLTPVLLQILGSAS